MEKLIWYFYLIGEKIRSLLKTDKLNNLNDETKTFIFLIIFITLSVIDTFIPNKYDVNPRDLFSVGFPSLTWFKAFLYFASFVTFTIGLYFAITWLWQELKSRKKN